MKRNQLVFFLIIGLAILIAGAGILLQSLGGGDDDPDTANTANTADTPIPHLTLEVAVNPLLVDWATEAARAYNAANTRGVTVRISEQDSLDIWTTGASEWSAQRHPDAWIPEAGYVVEFATQQGLDFELVEASLAQTPIIWGGYASRTEVILREYGEVSSQTVQEAAQAESWSSIGGASQWRFIKLAFSNPNRVESGLAALLTLLADYAETNQVDDEVAQDSEFRDWLRPIMTAVTDFNTPDPAQVMATTNTSQIEIALMPEAQWLASYSALTSREAIALFYPAYGPRLDFPLVAWADPDTRAAVEDFAAYLLDDTRQARLAEEGYRPVNGADVMAYAPFSQASEQVPATLPDREFSPPGRDALLSLLRWFDNES